MRAFHVACSAHDERMTASLDTAGRIAGAFCARGCHVDVEDLVAVYGAEVSWLGITRPDHQLVQAAEAVSAEQ